MRIHLLSVGRRMPPWVQAGFEDYVRRLPPECALRLVEIEPGQRGRGSAERARREEGERLLKAVPKRAAVIALDERGETWSTAQLAGELRGWLAGGRDLALLVGGADGLDGDCLAQAERRWSLSPLTFPHPLVRVILAEQIYRAWSLVNGHPYHRA
ncbi:23S rRNA (pseudouridine(1915)-N(3))-methyltransferase RlmH [Thiococcus pfennigii]|uniref:23S rRNA (pseudouridine(1915)-N(3))-methyltransferase RlmH n=1 Tax=Thiococcus pfennigii TaxID=1057 RepID=UPI00190335B3|nr:23S rRNA (pseudouridine(1915)-N(3))-methyltransferase RlmH [Thiococcus pfennigii]MBK1732683.1 23S rRNA (pseudouridine(1915)-N(3))-methyltransferase RlmH [Thiococcus pfennigii]